MQMTQHSSRPANEPADMLPINLIGKSPALQSVIDSIRRIANYDAIVSIYGETGTGKELVARSLHYLSSRKSGPFIPVNCGSLPDTLLESELFGHRRGAFTDARENKTGLVEQAAGGTLFLDEVEALTPKAQVSLLRFLQDMTFRRVGGSKTRTADVRIVVATNIDLDELRKAPGQFRSDLFYRLDVLPLRLPPLRERTTDIPLLAKHFLLQFASHYELKGKFLSSATLDWLMACEWSGNVRELENSIHRGLLFAPGDEVLPCHLKPGQLNTDMTDTPDNLYALSFAEAKQRAVESFERDYLRHSLEQSAGNITQAAASAQKERRAFGKLVKKYHIDVHDFQH